ARGASPNAAGRHPEVHRAGRATGTSRRSRRDQARDVGGSRGLRSGLGTGRRNVREAESAVGGDAVGAGERRAGDREWDDDWCEARTNFVRSRVPWTGAGGDALTFTPCSSPTVMATRGGTHESGAPRGRRFFADHLRGPGANRSI